MKTIWKHQLRVDDGPQDVNAPGHWHVRHVADQHGQPTLWLEVTPGEPITAQTFHVVGTGHPIEDWLTYVGTCHAPPFVWHVYQAPSFETPQERTRP